MATKGVSGGDVWSRALFYLGILLFVIISVLPLLWVFKMSIITKGELQASPPTILPHDPTTGSYAAIFADAGFLRSLLNSAVIAGVTTIVCLVLGSVAAYAIARLRFRFKSPRRTWIQGNTVFALPLTVWLLVAFFRELPFDLEEAAKVDGATTLQAFWKVIVPLSAPGVFTTAILTFIFAWNEFLFANTFAFDETTQPVTVSIPSFAGVFTVNYGAQAAAAVVVTVPLVILVLIFQRRIVSGLTAGAVKG